MFKVIKSYNTNEDIIVDEEDYSSLSTHNWSINPKGYAWSKINGKTTYMARLIMNCPKRMTVDHKNHNTLDNRKDNLRICTYSQNNYNRRCGNKNSKSIYKGVRKSFLDGKWQAEAISENNIIYVGSFYTEEYAAYMYNIRVSEIQKEYAYLNQLNLSETELIKKEKEAEKKYFRKINKLSKYRYVSYDKRYGWFGQKWINKKIIRTDYYNTEEEAHDEILKIINSGKEI